MKYGALDASCGRVDVQVWRNGGMGIWSAGGGVQECRRGVTEEKNSRAPESRCKRRDVEEALKCGGLGTRCGRCDAKKAFASHP